MPRIIEIRFPTDEETEAATRFTVHKNYVVALADCLTSLYGQECLPRLLEAQRSLPSFSRIQGGAAISEVEVQRFLPIAWSSELQLRLGAAGSPRTLRYTNAWAPVHAYYAVYMAMQAWFASNSMGQLVDDHTSSLRAIAAHIRDRRLFPGPFGAACVGCPDLKEARFIGFPADFDPATPIEVLSTPTPANFWPRYAKMLSTTRAKRLERNNEEWKRSKSRKKMFANEKRKVAENLGPTTLFDYLWRLRVRSNYRDVTSFLTWNVDDSSHAAFARALETVTEATCLLLESLFVRKGGKTVYDSLSGTFIRDHADALGDSIQFLRTRREILIG